jgi:L-fuconolactonase
VTLEEIMFALADSHIHLFRNGFAGRYGRSPVRSGSDVDVYESLREVHHIAAALVVGYEDDGIDPSNNAYLRELARSHDWMATLAYLRATDAHDAAGVERLLVAGHVGVALYLMDELSTAAVSSWTPDLWKPLDNAAAIVSVNAAADSLSAVEVMARAHGTCAFLISHLGDPGSHAEVPSRADAMKRLAPLLRLAALPNVHVKISGLYATSDRPFRFPHPQATPFVDLTLEAFGPERCLWGSDFSPCLDFISFEQALEPDQIARLGDTDRERVMGGNLIELLRAR